VSAADVDAAARRAARGDGDAFAAVCRALQGDVWRYCHALTGDRELAFEAAQETFLRAVTAIRRFRGDGPVRVWFLVLARRAVAEVLRRERRAPLPTPEGAAPEHHVPDATGRIAVEELVMQLPPDLRQAFVLTQLLGLSYEDAARVADCPVGTIRSRVYRSRSRLIDALSPRTEEETDVRTTR